MCVLSEVSEGYQMGTLQVTLLGSWKAEAGEPLRVQWGPPVCLRHKEDGTIQNVSEGCLSLIAFLTHLSRQSWRAWYINGKIGAGMLVQEAGRKGAALERQVTAAGHSHLTVPSLRLHSPPEAQCSPPLSALLEWLLPSQLSLLLFFHMEHKTKEQQAAGAREDP